MLSRSVILNMPSLIPLLILAGTMVVQAAPVDHDIAAIRTVYTTVTTTTTMTVDHVTVTGPCTHEPTGIVCSQHDHEHCIPPAPEPTHVVCTQEHECHPGGDKGKKGSKKLGLVTRNNNGACGDNHAVKVCHDGYVATCNCQAWGWDCACGPLEGMLKTITHMVTATASVTHTHMMDGGPCHPHTPMPTHHMPTHPMPTHTMSTHPEPTHPMPTHTMSTHPEPTHPPSTGRCTAGSSHELLHFDDFYDSYPHAIMNPTMTPASPFVFRDFTFDPDWTFALCENLQDQRNQTCNPTTPEGDYYISLYYQLAKPFVSRVSRRITYDLEHNSTSWELLSYNLSAFPKAGGEITVLMCAWSIHDQDKDIEPTFCHAEYFHEKSILRPVMIDHQGQELAFIEFTGYHGHYEPGTGKPEGGSSAKGLSPAEFFLDDMSVCVPSMYVH